MKKIIISTFILSIVTYFALSNDNKKDSNSEAQLSAEDSDETDQQILKDKNLQNAFKKIVLNNKSEERSPSSNESPKTIDQEVNNQQNPSSPPPSPSKESYSPADANNDNSINAESDNENKILDPLESYKDDITNDELELSNLRSRGADEHTINIEQDKLESKRKYLEYLETLPKK